MPDELKERRTCKDCKMASKLVAEPWTGNVNSPQELHTCTDILAHNADKILREDEPACTRFSERNETRPRTL